METTESTPSKATFVARLIVGGYFAYLGWLKLQGDPIAFLKVIREYQLVGDEHYRILNFVAATLPFAEIVLGALLVLGIARRGAALVVLAMLVPFTIAIYARGTGIAEQSGQTLCAIAFDCGCGTGVVQVCRKLAENCSLIVLATWLVIARSSALALRDSMLNVK